MNIDRPQTAGARPAMQARSRETTLKIVSALEDLLKIKSFEQITMSEIAKGAEITPGAIYRRFENKEGLLPHIFQRYEDELTSWLERVSLESILGRDETLPGALSFVVSETLKCFRDQAHIFRTVHLYGRLYPTAIQHLNDRNKEFEPFASLLKHFRAEISHPPKQAAAFIGHTLVANCIERAQYPDHFPALGLKMSDKKFSENLAEMFCEWLTVDA